MSENPIVFIDSGIGGLPYLDWVRKRLPEENCIYVADTAFFPYGTKQIGQIRKNLVDLVGKIAAQFGPKAVAIVCNTASVTSLKTLRNTYTVPFIGVVPAVKPAAEMTKTGEIALLATERTVDDQYTKKLIEDYAHDCRVIKIGTAELAGFIENEYFSGKKSGLEKIIGPITERIKKTNADFLVLACTHYVYIRRELEEILGPGVHVIDSREGVGNRIKEIVAGESGASKDGMSGMLKTKRRELYTTSSVPEYEKFARMFNLDFKGCLFNGN